MRTCTGRNENSPLVTRLSERWKGFADASQTLFSYHFSVNNLSLAQEGYCDTPLRVRDAAKVQTVKPIESMQTSHRFYCFDKAVKDSEGNLLHNYTGLS